MVTPNLSRPLQVALLGVMPAVLFAGLVAIAIHDHDLGYDMRVLVGAGRTIADGLSPWPGLTYPPLLPFLLVPVGLLPAAEEVLAFAALLSVPLSLRLVGVRDWRCYGAALLWAPVFSGVQTANATLFLVLGAAATWRLRDSRAAGGAVAGLATAVKFISLPLVVWLASTRRVATAAVAAVVAAGATVGLTLVAEQVLTRQDGGAGGGSVAASVGDVPGIATTQSYSIIDMVRQAGASSQLGYVAQGLAVLALCCLVARFGLRGEIARSFAAANVATLVAAPNVWLHSFSFLLLAVAVRRPSLSPVWLAPALLFVVPVVDPGVAHLVVAWAVSAVVAVTVIRPDRVRSADAARPAVPSLAGADAIAVEAWPGGRPDAPEGIVHTRRRTGATRR